jgi:hypothetical protein
MSSNTSSIYLETEVDTHVLILTASHSPSAANYFLSILEILQLRLYLILSKLVLQILLRRILHLWVGISLVGVWGFLFRRGSFVSLFPFFFFFFELNCVFLYISSTLTTYYYGNLTYPSQDPPKLGFLSTVPSDASSRMQSAASAAAKANNNFPGMFFIRDIYVARWIFSYLPSFFFFCVCI